MICFDSVEVRMFRCLFGMGGGWGQPLVSHTQPLHACVTVVGEGGSRGEGGERCLWLGERVGGRRGFQFSRMFTLWFYPAECRTSCCVRMCRCARVFVT